MARLLAGARGGPAGRKPGRLASGWSLFSGLGSKVLQIDEGADVPRVPPSGRFLGDVLDVTVTGHRGPERAPHTGPGLWLRFVADRDSREGVLTELLAQPLTCAHNAARPRSYVSLGFASFEAGVPVEAPVSLSIHWACAVRFVEASSGRDDGPCGDRAGDGPGGIGRAARARRGWGWCSFPLPIRSRSHCGRSGG